MSISPGRLLDISGVGDPVAVSQHNAEVLTEEIFKFTPSYQNGVATTVIGPPTSGTHILDELWKDAWNAVWRCTVAGTPGTWRQETPGVREGEPASGTIPTGYIISDSTDRYRTKIHMGSYVWQDAADPYRYGHLTGLTGGGDFNLDGVVTTSLPALTLAQFINSSDGALVTYRLTSTTAAEFSPFQIRPDDYNASTNAKVWVRTSYHRYPGMFFSMELSGLTGGTSADLNGIPTAPHGVGRAVAFLYSDTFVIYRLRAGTDATASPTIIRPADFQSSTNAKVWERMLTIATPGDALISNNNLSEINTAAKRISARSNLDVHWANDSVGRSMNRVPRGGIFFDGVTSTNNIAGASGGTLLSLGTSDFTVAFAMTAKDWTPSSTGIFFMSHSTGNSRFYLEIMSTGVLRFTFVDSGGSSAQYSMTPDVALTDGETYHFVLTADRDGSATLYINGVSDRDKSGSGVTVSISASSAVDIGSGNTNGYHLGSTLIGCTIHSFVIFNRLLTSTDAGLLARTGSVDHMDQYGSLSATYTSDFSAGVDSWTTGIDVTPTGNNDAISDGTTSKNDCLKLTTSTGGSLHYVFRTTLSKHKRYKFTCSYYIPSGLAFARIRVGYSTTGSSSASTDLTTVGSWATGSGELVAGEGASIILALVTSAGATTFNGTSGQAAYLKDLVFTEVGALIDLDLDNANPSQSLVVRDRSTSSNHGTSSASEVYQDRPLQQINPSRLSVGASTVLTKLISATATLDFGSIAAAASADLTITVTGAAVGDAVAIGLPAAPAAGIVFFGFVSATNTVTIRAMNITALAVDPASATYRATVFSF